MRSVVRKVVMGAALAAGFSVFAADLPEQRDAALFQETVKHIDQGGIYLNYSKFPDLTRLCEILTKANDTFAGSLDPAQQQQFQLISATIGDVISILNLQAIQATAVSDRLDGSYQGNPLHLIRSYTMLESSRPEGALFAFAPENQPFTYLDRIPVNARLAFDGHLTPGKVWQEVSKRNTTVKNPLIAQGMMMAEQACEQNLSVSLPALLNSISGEYFLLVTSDSADGMLSGMVMVVIPDRDGVLSGVLRKSLASANQGQPLGEVFRVPRDPGMPPWLAPEIRFEAGRVVILSNPAILTAADPKNAAMKDAELASFFQDANGAGTSFFYLNVPRELVNSALMMADAQEESGSFLDEFSLPAMSGVSRWENNGVAGTVRSVYSFEAQTVLLPMIFTSGTLLPALNQARTKARGVACVSQQKQIALGVMMYAADHQNRFPQADSVAAVQTPVPMAWAGISGCGSGLGVLFRVTLR